MDLGVFLEISIIWLILNTDEVVGGREYWIPDMQNFRDCIANAGLGHIKIVGPLHTWTNKRLRNPILKRLDRILGNQDWFLNFTESTVQVKSRGLMDHCPLMLHIPIEVDKINKQFHYFYHMSNIEGFEDVVTRAWISDWYGDSMSIMCKKLNLVKQELFIFNKRCGNVQNNVHIARQELNSIQEKLFMIL